MGKWDIVNDQSNANFGVRHEIIYNTEYKSIKIPMITIQKYENLWYYSNAYILVRDNNIIMGDKGTQVPFEN